MSDLLETASSWLGGVLATHASQTGSYSRRATTLAGVTFTVAETRWEAGGESLVVDWQGIDCIITIDSTSALLAAFGIPQRGDRLTWGSEVYEIRAPEGMPPWRYSDRYDQRIRAHAVRVAE